MDSEKDLRKLLEELRSKNPTQYYTLIKMHLSFATDIPTDQCDGSFDNGSSSSSGKWNLSPLMKRFIRPSQPSTNSSDKALSIPVVHQLFELMSFLNHDHNIVQEGLFRKAGSMTRQAELKGELLTGQNLNLVEGNYSAHDCASVLKSFLADLPEPLLQESQYHVHCRIAEMCGNDDLEQKTTFNRKIKALQLIFLLLPPVNYSILKELLLLLHRVTLFEEQNKMTALNLGTMFAPHILCPRKTSASELQLLSGSLSTAIAFIITNAPSLFEVPSELEIDVREYFRNQSSSSHSPEYAPDDCVSRTCFTFLDRELTARANCDDVTEVALAELYAYVQSLPDSSRKNKLILQFNQASGKGTPKSCQKRPEFKMKSFGDSIKRHLFNKCVKKHKTTPQMVQALNIKRSNSEDLLSTPKFEIENRKHSETTKAKSLDNLLSTPVSSKFYRLDHPENRPEDMVKSSLKPPKIGSGDGFNICGVLDLNRSDFKSHGIESSGLSDCGSISSPCTPSNFSRKDALFYPTSTFQKIQKTPISRLSSLSDTVQYSSTPICRFSTFGKNNEELLDVSASDISEKRVSFEYQDVNSSSFSSVKRFKEQGKVVDVRNFEENPSLRSRNRKSGTENPKSGAETPKSGTCMTKPSLKFSSFGKEIVENSDNLYHPSKEDLKIYSNYNKMLSYETSPVRNLETTEKSSRSTTENLQSQNVDLKAPKKSLKISPISRAIRTSLVDQDVIMTPRSRVPIMINSSLNSTSSHECQITSSSINSETDSNSDNNADNYSIMRKNVSDVDGNGDNNIMRKTDHDAYYSNSKKPTFSMKTFEKTDIPEINYTDYDLTNDSIKNIPEVTNISNKNLRTDTCDLLRIQGQNLSFSMSQNDLNSKLQGQSSVVQNNFSLNSNPQVSALQNNFNVESEKQSLPQNSFNFDAEIEALKAVDNTNEHLIDNPSEAVNASVRLRNKLTQPEIILDKRLSKPIIKISSSSIDENPNEELDNETNLDISLNKLERGVFLNTSGLGGFFSNLSTTSLVKIASVLCCDETLEENSPLNDSLSGVFKDYLVCRNNDLEVEKSPGMNQNKNQVIGDVKENKSVSEILQEQLNFDTMRSSTGLCGTTQSNVLDEDNVDGAQSGFRAADYCLDLCKPSDHLSESLLYCLDGNSPNSYVRKYSNNTPLRVSGHNLEIPVIPESSANTTGKSSEFTISLDEISVNSAKSPELNSSNSNYSSPQSAISSKLNIPDSNSIGENRSSSSISSTDSGSKRVFPTSDNDFGRKKNKLSPIESNNKDQIHFDITNDRKDNCELQNPKSVSEERNLSPLNKNAPIQRSKTLYSCSPTSRSQSLLKNRNGTPVLLKLEKENVIYEDRDEATRHLIFETDL